MAVLLGACAVSAFIAMLLIAATGGFRTSLGPLPLIAEDPFRAYYIGVLFLCAALWRADRRAAQRDADDRWGTVAPWIAVSACVLVLVVAIRYGAFVAGGADAYGYVAEALLWTHGHLHVAEPLAHLSPSLGAAVAPLGFRLAGNGVNLVPIYPPGLPLAMALAVKAAGFTGAFFVVPTFAAVAVGTTYVLGARLGGRRAGLTAAALLACSPIFLLQSMQPMSDVPAAALWLVAIALASTRRVRGSAFLSGITVAAAITVRPNLAPLAAVVAALAVVSTARLQTLAWFALGVIPGPLVIAAVNSRLYGSPVMFGYGSNATLFGLLSVGANLKRYSFWLLQIQTPFVFLALAAPLLPANTIEPYRRQRMVLLLLLAFVAALLGCYLIYIPFDSWAFLRFLLPGIPLLLLLSCLTIVRLISLAPVSARRGVLVGVCALLCGQYIEHASELNVFRDTESQHRYLAVAAYVDRTLPKNAVVVSLVQSGSLRLYGHRETLRWDVIASDDFDRSIGTLFANGFEPYILVEGSERQTFDTRFGQTRYGALNWPPMARYNRYEEVLLYSASDWQRARSGRWINTVDIQP